MRRFEDRRWLFVWAVLWFGLFPLSVEAQNANSQTANPPATDTRQTVGETDWPQFLGRNRDGHSNETGLNVDWRRSKPHVLWRSSLGGGFSSLVIIDDRLYTMSSRSRRDYVLCFDARTGEEVWSTPVGTSFTDRQRMGQGPRATPTFDDGMLYCLHPEGDLLCVRAADGEIQWRTNIFRISQARRHTQETYYWGMSASPLVEGDLVITQPGGDRNNSVVAVHKETGKLAWSVGSDPPGYGSPIALTALGQRQVVVTTGQSFLGIDPKEGRLLWRHAWGNKYNCNCATPVWTGEALFVSSAYDTGAALLEIVDAGSRIGAVERWKNRSLQNQFATSLLIDGKIYGPHGDLGGITFRCLDQETGKMEWVSRGAGRCSLIAAQGHLIALTEQGTLLLIEANPDRYVEKGRLENLLSAKAWAPPALAKKRLYVRDEKSLLCIDLAETSQSSSRTDRP